MRKLTIPAVAALLFGLMAAPVLAGVNLMANPNLEQGSNDQPSAWRTQRLLPGGGSFAWVRKSGGELQVTNDRFDVAQWSQPMTLPIGSYRLTGEVRSQGDGTAILGVWLGASVQGWSPSVTSAPNPSGFSTGEFYFKVDEAKEIRVVCRLSGRGTARFRNLSLTRVAAAPASAALLKDSGEDAGPPPAQLDFMAKPFDRPIGHLWSEILLLGIVAAIFGWGWRQLAMLAPHKPD